MTAEALTVPVVPDFIGRVEGRLFRDFAAALNDWSECVPALTHWEDEHLLDNPSPEMLARHRATIERLLRFGEFIALASRQPGFPDRQLAEIAASTRQTLRDKLAMWHGAKSSTEERASLLAACFPG